MSNRIEELENENLTVKVKLQELGEANEVSLPTSLQTSPIIVDSVAGHKNRLLNSARRLGQNLQTAAEAAHSPSRGQPTEPDGNGTPSTQAHVGSPRKLSLKENVLLSAQQLGHQLESATAAASGTKRPEERMITPPNALPIGMLSAETPYFTPQAMESSTPRSSISEPLQWKPAEVKAWLSATLKLPTVAANMFADAVGGADLIELQFHDLIAYGIESSADAERVLVKTTELFVANPIAAKVPVSEWDVYQGKNLALFTLDTGIVMGLPRLTRLRVLLQSDIGC